MECRVGYTVDLQFTLNQEDYFFDTLEAVSTTDETQSRADYVEITFNEKASDQSKGIYKYTVKLLKYADDILIRPKCVVLPRVISCSPLGTDTQYAGTPIFITFNVPVQDEDAVESILNSDTITIYSPRIEKPIESGSSYKRIFNDAKLNEYFYTPTLNDQKTKLIIIPKFQELMELIQIQSNSYIEIMISFSQNLTVTKDGYELPVQQDLLSDFTVKYGLQLDTIAPEFKDCYITNEEITLETAPFLEDNKKCYSGKYDGFYNKTTCLVSSTFYIYGKCLETGSGVASILVGKSLGYTMSGGIGSGFTDNKTYFLDDSNSFDYEIDEKGNLSFIIKYSLTTGTPGLYQIDVTLTDNAENASVKKSNVINWLENGEFGWGSRYKGYYTMWDKENNKYTEDSWGILPTPFDVCNAPFSKAASDNTCYDFSQYNSDIKTLTIKDEDVPSLFWTESNGAYRIKADEVEYYCEYVDRNGTQRTEPFTPYNPAVMKRTITLDVEKVSGMTVYIIPVYKGIPLGRQPYTFPSAATLSSIDENSINIAPMSGSTDETYLPVGICRYPDNRSKIIILSGNTIQKSNIPDNAQCYFGYVRLTGKNQAFLQSADPGTELDETFNATTYFFDRGLISELIGPYTKTQTAVTQPSAPVTVIEKSKGQENLINITYKWSSDLWQTYDSLKCTLTRKPYSTIEVLSDTILSPLDTFVKDGNVCYTVSVEFDKFFKNKTAWELCNFTYTCTGVKNNIESSKETQTISLSPQERSSLDSVKPSELIRNNIVYTKGTGADKKAQIEFLVSFDDGESGPLSGEITINNYSQKYDMIQNQENNYRFDGYIPFGDLFWGVNVFNYIVKDKKNNVREGNNSHDLKLGFDHKHICIKDISFDSDSHQLKGDISHYKGEIYDNKGKLVIYGYKVSDSTCAIIKTYTQQDMQDESFYANPKITLDVSGYDFVEAFCAINNGVFNTDNVLYYTGDNPGSGKNNFIIPNGSSKESVVISSDSNVLVRFCSVKQTLANCAGMSIDDWEMFSRYMDVLDFRTGTPGPQVFDMSDYIENISSGSCYCVIAYFANGNPIMSEVMQKP